MFKKKFFKNIKFKKGAAVVETALCLPVILYLIFFILEAIRMTIFQVAVDSMSIEMSFEYSALKTTEHFDEIMANNKPAFLGPDETRYYINVYPSLEQLISTSFGAQVQWPLTNVPSANILLHDFLPSDLYPDGSFKSGAAFELTVVCDYKFTSSLVSRLFAGGSNSADGRHFFVWARSICVCN